MIALVLLGGLSVSLWQMRRAMQAEAQANTNEQKANQNARQAEQSRKDTEKALRIVESEKAKALAAEALARDEEEAGRKLLYTTDMRLAPFVWRDDRSTAGQLRGLLAKHIPPDPSSLQKPDLRGFEWYYYQHLLENSAAVFSGHDVPCRRRRFHIEYSTGDAG